MRRSYSVSPLRKVPPDGCIGIVRKITPDPDATALVVVYPERDDHWVYWVSDVMSGGSRLHYSPLILLHTNPSVSLSSMRPWYEAFLQLLPRSGVDIPWVANPYGPRSRDSKPRFCTCQPRADVAEVNVCCGFQTEA